VEDRKIVDDAAARRIKAAGEYGRGRGMAD